MAKLSIIVPVYNEESNILPFLSRVVPICKALSADYEVIFSMDPCHDNTEQLILEFRKSDSRIKVIKYSRRIGQQMAIIGGMSYATGDALIVIDVDLQDPPELICEMWQLFNEGWDVVLAKRRKRDGETLIRRFITKVGYWLINKVTQIKIPADTGDFRLMSRRVSNEVVRLKECHGFLRGLVALVGFKQTTIEFDRPARHSGTSNYSRFFGSLKVGFDGVFCFSNFALALSTKFGFICAGTAFIFAFFSVLLKFSGAPYPMGYSTTIVVIFFLGGVQLICLGIIGEYIGRIYDEVKQRPKYIVDSTAGFDLPSSP